MRRLDPLRAALALMEPRVPRLVAAIVLGAVSLGSALALTAVSAWLITRAWQMPPILDLSIAVVAVRTLGISRAVLGYFERLASHDTALRAAGTARGALYRRLARSGADVSRVRSGELMSRVGADVDTLAEAVARALVPIGVAVVLGIGAAAGLTLISPAAAGILVLCLLVAGGFAPWLAARAASAQEHLARTHHAERDTTTLTALDHAGELRVAGRLPTVIADAERSHTDWARALDRAAAPAAATAAVLTAATGISVIGAILIGITIAPHTAPTTLAVLMLVPLAAFEAVAALPAAAVALTRARIAAARLISLVPPLNPGADVPIAVTRPPATPHLRAVDLCAGFPGSRVTQPITLDLPPGYRLAVTGRSGTGKTALLMTIAGLLAPIGGRITYDGADGTELSESQLRSAACFFAEDAHLFSTTVRDNLLVARGDCSDDTLDDALHKVGLRSWLDGLPDGLDTVLRGGSAAVSAGQRRRLLLARVLVSPAPVVLLDEPTEHLDAADAERMLAALLDRHAGLIGPDRSVIVATHHLGSGIGRTDLSTNPGYDVVRIR